MFDKRFQYLVLIGCVLGATGCSSIGRLTVRNYTAANGRRVMVGQAEPETAYDCRKLSQERQDWGFSERMDKAAAMEKLRTKAVEQAAAKGANYADLIIPGQASVMGFDVNAFKDARVAYYACSKLPPPTK